MIFDKRERVRYPTMEYLFEKNNIEILVLFNVNKKLKKLKMKYSYRFINNVVFDFFIFENFFLGLAFLNNLEILRRFSKDSLKILI